MTAPTAPAMPSAAPEPRLRLVAVVGAVEAVSYLVLLAGSVWHHGFDGPETAPLLGPIHGFLFLAYVAVVLAVRVEANWSLGRTVLLLAAGILPLGGFVVARRLES